jgi:hypothetical protein
MNLPSTRSIALKDLAQRKTSFFAGRLLNVVPATDVIAFEQPTYHPKSACKNECRRFFRFARGNPLPNVVVAVCLHTSFVVVFPRLGVAFRRT